MDIYRDLVEVLLPEDILKHFELTDFKQVGIELKIYLEEKNIPPEKYKDVHIRANGFVPEVEIKDFPIRTKLVTLHVKRRRWLLVEENKKVMRDLHLKTPGTRLSNEFSAFLKGFLDNYPIDSPSLEKHYGVKGSTIQRYYKNNLSNYRQWDQLAHCEKYILFPENISPYLSIDETSVSQGELYTIVTNKLKGGKKGGLVAVIKGTNSKDIIPILLKFSNEKRLLVKEITLDMAGSMNLIVDKCFPRAMKVIDRFHVQKLAYDAVQQLRIKHRWEAIEEENNGITFNYPNGDSKKQLLARGRYALYKSRSNWTKNQAIRAEIIFQEYPDLKQAYELAQKLGYIL